MLSLTKVGKIKKRFPIVEFIESQGVRLNKIGDTFQGNCPFHEDQTPSLKVTPSKGLWNCFGCNKGGDVITFYQNIKNIDNRQAIDELSKVDQLSKVNTVKSKVEAVKIKTVLGDVSKLYHSSLMTNEEAKSYLKGRGLTNPDLLTKYQIGYCDGKKLSSIISGNKQIFQECRDLGLINDKGNESFYKCITFPLIALSGEIVGFYGRGIEGKRHQYSKGDRKGLFNASACENVEEIILTESIIDALSLIQLGFMNVLPMFGVNGHTPTIQSFIEKVAPKEIILFLDNDQVAKDSAKELVATYKKKQQPVSEVRLPNQIKDINEFLSNGATRQDVEQLLEQRIKHTKIKAIKEEGLIYRDQEQVLFKYDELNYRVKGPIKDQDSMKLILSAFSENSKHIDRIDLYSDRSRKGFANQIEQKCQIKASKVEEDLLNILFVLEEKPQKKTEKVVNAV